jgi:hypothetical protein
MIGLPELDFELTTLSNPSGFSRGIPIHTEEEEGLFRCLDGYARAKGANPLKPAGAAPPETGKSPTDKTDRSQAAAETLTTPAVCPRCGQPVAPLLIVRGDGTLATVCPRGHWTRARKEPAA